MEHPTGPEPDAGPESGGQGTERGRRHGHVAGHGHGLEGGWSPWLANRALRWLLVWLAAAAVAAIAGLIILWPDGSGRDAAIARADEVGLVTDRFEATVESVTDAECTYATPGNEQQCRTITVIPGSGPDAGSLVLLPEFSLAEAGFAPEVGAGDEIIVGYEPENDFYFYADRDRQGSLLAIAALFAVVVVALGRLRGLLALVAMVVTAALLVGFVAPSVLDGNDPVVVAVVAAAAIAFVSLYLTHGFNPTTTAALAGTLMALGLTLAISWVFFEAANFTGLATEEGLTIPLVAVDVDVASLLLGGAVIGALGALDDVTVTQVVTVAELRTINPSLTRRQLTASGIRVGREHIAATVNTLLLAYVGASMPLLLLFVVSNQSLAMVANSELIAVEIMRTLCGSVGLVAAVPITTLLAATLVSSQPPGDASADAPPTGPSADASDPGDASADAWMPGASADAHHPTPAPLEVAPPPEPEPRWEDFAPEDDPEGF